MQFLQNGSNMSHSSKAPNLTRERNTLTPVINAAVTTDWVGSNAHNKKNPSGCSQKLLRFALHCTGNTLIIIHEATSGEVFATL